MIRVRLFRSERPVGFISFNETVHRMRPQGVLPEVSVEAIRKELARGHVAGLIDLCTWYRQATPFCPLDPTRACPCDEEACGEGTPP